MRKINRYTALMNTKHIIVNILTKAAFAIAVLLVVSGCARHNSQDMVFRNYDYINDYDTAYIPADGGAFRMNNNY